MTSNAPTLLLIKLLPQQPTHFITSINFGAMLSYILTHTSLLFFPLWTCRQSSLSFHGPFLSLSFTIHLWNFSSVLFVSQSFADFSSLLYTYLFLYLYLSHAFYLNTQHFRGRPLISSSSSAPLDAQLWNV